MNITCWGLEIWEQLLPWNNLTIPAKDIGSGPLRLPVYNIPEESNWQHWRDFWNDTQDPQTSHKSQGTGPSHPPIHLWNFHMDKAFHNTTRNNYESLIKSSLALYTVTDEV